MTKKIVGFKIREEDFALDIMKVVEIIKIKNITEVPTAPSFIEGIINLRGRIIPVIDLRKRLNVEVKTENKNYRIIITELNKNQKVGFIVDEVTKVFSVEDNQFLPVPSTITQAGGKYIESIVKIDEKIFILLDIEKIFSETEKIELNDIIIDIAGGNLESQNSSNS